MDENHLEIQFLDRTLTIDGERDEEAEDAEQDHFVSERHYGDFHRTFRVPEPVDADKIKAHLKNALLTITLPKTAEARRKRKMIEVK